LGDGLLDHLGLWPPLVAQQLQEALQSPGTPSAFTADVLAGPIGELRVEGLAPKVGVGEALPRPSLSRCEAELDRTSTVVDDEAA
jgi:hypothetical protein